MRAVYAKQEASQLRPARADQASKSEDFALPQIEAYAFDPWRAGKGAYGKNRLAGGSSARPFRRRINDAANDRLNVALLPLMRMQENYPQLKSNDQFMRLQDELAGTENRIAVARRRYDESIRDYNTFIQQFPNSIWANFAGFHTRNEYYSADQGARTAPKVDFSK